MTPNEAHTFIIESVDRAYNHLKCGANKPKGIKFIETPNNDYMTGFTVDYDKSMITSIQLKGTIHTVTIEGTLSYED